MRMTLMRIFSSVLALLIFCSVLQGCSVAKSVGVGKWPFKPYISPSASLAFTDDERQRLKVFKVVNADLVEKIQKHELETQTELIARREADEAYMKEAISHNKDQLKNLLGWSDAEANDAIRNQLLKLGYPEDHEFVKGLK